MQTLAQRRGVFGSERLEGGENLFDRLVEGDVRIDFCNQRDIGIVVMQLDQSQNPPAQFVIAKERRKILPNRGNQSVINRHGDIVAEQRGFERGGIISGACAEDIGLHRVGE